MLGELARRTDDQRVDVVLLARRHCVRLAQQVDDRHDEGERLARARDRLDHHVLVLLGQNWHHYFLHRSNARQRSINDLIRFDKNLNKRRN